MRIDATAPDTDPGAFSNSLADTSELETEALGQQDVENSPDKNL